MKFKPELNSIYICAKLRVEDIKKEMEKKQNEFNKYKKMFEEICKNDEDAEDTKFGKDIKSYFEENMDAVEKALKNWEKV